MGVSSTTKRSGTGRSSVSIWNALCLLGVLVLGGVHVFQMAAVTEAGYHMRDLEVAVEDLELQTERMETQIAEIMSLGAVADRMQILGFVESQNVVYLSDLDSLAVR